LAARPDNLTERAAYLRNAAPVQYNEFVQALEHYAREAAERCVLADGEVQVMQGQARQCKELLRILRDAGVKHG
jgi:hypothetical protein